MFKKNGFGLALWWLDSPQSILIRNAKILRFLVLNLSFVASSAMWLSLVVTVDDGPPLWPPLWWPGGGVGLGDVKMTFGRCQREEDWLVVVEGIWSCSMELELYWGTRAIVGGCSRKL